MADIDVSLKFEYSADPSDIRSQIEAAIKTISANPPKVKVTADITEAKKNLDALQKQITALTKQKVTLNIGAGASGSNAKPKDLVKDTVAYNNALAALNNAMTQTRNKMKNWSAAATGSSSGAYNTLNDQIQAMEALESRIKSGGVSVKDFAKEFSEIKASVAEASNEVAKFQENTKAISVSVEDETKAYKKLFTMLGEVDKVKAKFGESNQANTTNSFKTIVDQEKVLNNLFDSYKNGTISFDQFKKSLADVDQEIIKNKTELSNLGAITTNSVENETKSYKKLFSMLSDIDKVRSKWGNVSDISKTQDYQGIIDQEQKLKDLFNDYKNKNIDLKEFQKGLADIDKDIAQNKANLAESGQAFGNFGNGIMQAAQQIGTFLVSYRMVMMALQNIKKMIAASIEIESSMNRIQIVTGATDSQMTQFFETAASHAKELGTSISEVAGSIEVFSRLGLTNRPLVQ